MSSMKVLIVDYGLGNLFNVQRALEAIGAEAAISSSPDDLRRAERVILPGVGAFGAGMAGLRARSLVEPLKDYAASGRPLFGICLGMQLLMTESEELGLEQGLGLVDGRVTMLHSRDAQGRHYKIPHIGWNRVLPSVDREWRGTVLEGLDPGSATYFLHSYAVAPEDKAWVIGETEYGPTRFCALLQRGNIMGCQSHPERSGPVGLRIFRNFLSL